MNVQVTALFTVITLAAIQSSVVAGSTQVTVPMNAMSSSGQNGSAKITRASGDHITITIDLNGEPYGLSEPVMIHPGTCSDLKSGPKTVLNPVVEGRSITTMTSPAFNTGPRAIVVHKGVGSELNTIVSCGELHIS